MGALNVFVQPLAQLWGQMLIFVPRIIVAIVIWLVGKYLIELGVTLIKKVDIKGTKLDNYLTNILSKAVYVVGKILLILVILDYLGVGRSIVSALANGLTITIAIALGLAFGKALEDDAKLIVEETKKHMKKTSTKK